MCRDEVRREVWSCVKRGADSVMVQSCSSASDVGDPVKIDGIMNTDSLILIHTMARNVIKKVSGWHGFIY